MLKSESLCNSVFFVSIDIILGLELSKIEVGGDADDDDENSNPFPTRHPSHAQEDPIIRSVRPPHSDNKALCCCTPKPRNSSPLCDFTLTGGRRAPEDDF